MAIQMSRCSAALMFLVYNDERPQAAKRKVTMMLILTLNPPPSTLHPDTHRRPSARSKRKTATSPSSRPSMTAASASRYLCFFFCVPLQEGVAANDAPPSPPQERVGSNNVPPSPPQERVAAEVQSMSGGDLLGRLEAQHQLSVHRRLWYAQGILCYP
jgi:hypothetical protein